MNGTSHSIEKSSLWAASRTSLISARIWTSRTQFIGRRIACRMKTGYTWPARPYVMKAMLLRMPTTRSGIIVRM